MSSPKYAATLQELRQQRGLLDQAIVALEILNGERPMPEITHVFVEPARPQKLLTAVTPTKRKVAARTGKATPPPTAPKASDTRVSQASHSDDEIVEKAIKSLGGSARKEQVAAATKLNNTRLVNAKNRMVYRGQLAVAGHARAARWVLSSSTKEAP